MHLSEFYITTDILGGHDRRTLRTYSKSSVAYCRTRRSIHLLFLRSCSCRARNARQVRGDKCTVQPEHIFTLLQGAMPLAWTSISEIKGRKVSRTKSNLDLTVIACSVGGIFDLVDIVRNVNHGRGVEP